MPISLEEMLGKSLDALLSLSWLSLLPKAGVFLVEQKDNGNAILKLVVDRHLGKEIPLLCAQVRFGHCLCGRVAESQAPLHVSHIDHRHETVFDGIQPHGHYVIPVQSGEAILGVLVFYLQDGTPKDQQELNFLIRCGSVLALGIELRQKERELKAANRELTLQKKTLDQHAIVSISDAEGQIIYVNNKFCEISGYSREELLGQNHRMLKSKEHSQEVYKDMWQTITSGEVWHGEIKNRRKDGGYYWVNATIVPFMDENGKPFQFVAIRTDITERKAIEYALQQAQSIASIGSWSLDLLTGRLMWSDQVFTIFGINPKEFDASFAAFLENIHTDDRQHVELQYEASCGGHIEYDIEHRIIRKDNGEIRWVHERCVHQRNDKGEVIRSDGIVQDITERKLAQEEIQRLAMVDQLTGLANRNQFHSRFAESIRLAKRHGFRLALLLLDLDKFKPVNDTYGHQIGDELLKVIAAGFARETRESDVAARLGGDEFAILMINPDGNESIDKGARRIIEEVSKTVDIRGFQINIGVSIGISIYPTNGSEEDELIHKADVALYESKRTGRNTYCFYVPELEKV